MNQGQGDDGHHGHGKDIHEACIAAYEAARAAGKTPPFVVTKIELQGTNPFDGFKITVGP